MSSNAITLVGLPIAANGLLSARSSVSTVPLGTGTKLLMVDTGKGFEPADLDKIFKPFYTTKKHGLGLGLPICRSIIAAHKGRLLAEASERAGGSPGATFHLELPPAAEGKL